jgi:hypothetical protein
VASSTTLTKLSSDATTILQVMSPRLLSSKPVFQTPSSPNTIPFSEVEATINLPIFGISLFNK